MDKPALVSLTFDDGLRCQFEVAVPILDEYGFAATFFLVANTDQIFTAGFAGHRRWPKIDWSERDRQLLKGMVQRGHEIGSHSVNHKNRCTDKNPAFEAGESRRRIEEWMGVEIRSFCYPFYHRPDFFKHAVAAAGYRQARAGANSSYYSGSDSIDWFDVDCRRITENENVSGWMRPDGWHILMFHGIGTRRDGWSPISADRFGAQMAELAKYRDSGSVEVVTFKDGADRLRLLNSALSSAGEDPSPCLRPLKT